MTVRISHIAPDKLNRLVLPRRRVLVTGFHDWKEDAKTNNWLCKINPSGRLILGAPHTAAAQPTQYIGPLVKYLQEKCEYTKTTNVMGVGLEPIKIDWDFDTMPTVWNICLSADHKAAKFEQYDAIISTGLGVYNKYNKLILEYGAQSAGKLLDVRGVDLQGGTDSSKVFTADNAQAVTWLDPGATSFSTTSLKDRFAEFLSDASNNPGTPPDVQVRKKLRKKSRYRSTKLSSLSYSVYISGQGDGDSGNNYVCNNTHYWNLRHLIDSLTSATSRLRQTFLIHMPYASSDGDPSVRGHRVLSADEHVPLAEALGALIHELVSW